MFLYLLNSVTLLGRTEVFSSVSHRRRVCCSINCVCAGVNLFHINSLSCVKLLAVCKTCSYQTKTLFSWVFHVSVKQFYHSNLAFRSQLDQNKATRGFYQLGKALYQTIGYQKSNLATFLSKLGNTTEGKHEASKRRAYQLPCYRQGSQTVETIQTFPSEFTEVADLEKGQRKYFQEYNCGF